MCRLKPPVSASTSSTSPAAYRPRTSLDSRVEGLNSFTSAPPAVITAASMGSAPVTGSGSALVSSASRCRTALGSSQAGICGGNPASAAMAGARAPGNRPLRIVAICFFPAAAVSRSRRCSSCSALSPGFKSSVSLQPLRPARRLEAVSTSGPDTPRCVNSISPISFCSTFLPSVTVSRTFLSDRPCKSRTQRSSQISPHSAGLGGAMVCPQAESRAYPSPVEPVVG